MILIAGGTGTLGTQVVRLLTARGLEVRILTRDPARARHLRGDLVEIVPGDVRDLRAVERAAVGARTVISAIQGLTGTGGYSPQTVDRQGNSNLIQAAQTGAAECFILVSVQGAAPDHPMELARMKYLAEQELKASGLAWTIIRASAFMETWAALIGEPLIKTGKTRIFGAITPSTLFRRTMSRGSSSLPSSSLPCAVSWWRSAGRRTSA
jgi:NADH dehydrogenase